MDLLIFAILMSTVDYTDKQWISRCFTLARRGIGNVSPNPPVGAVLVHEGKILSEGYHSCFGGAHAEVEALKNVPADQRHLIPEATLYVSLEPCCIYNKTPPCTDLILREGIMDVRVSTLDPNPKIAGSGIDILRAHGVKVITGILEEEGRELINAFKTNILLHRPYVILKWAQSKELFIGKKDHRILISHPHTTTWSHSLRAIADAIMVGARTVMIDNPKLTTRDAPGKSPHRVVYDPGGKLKNEYYVFNNDERRIFYFSITDNANIDAPHISKYLLRDNESHAHQIINILFTQQIGILLVEGGSFLFSLFIKDNLWDEAWVIHSTHPLNEGVKAPVVKGKLIHEMKSATDTIIGIKNEEI